MKWQMHNVEYLICTQNHSSKNNLHTRYLFEKFDTILDEFNWYLFLYLMNGDNAGQVRPSVTFMISEPCTCCHATGRVEALETSFSKIEQEICQLLVSFIVSKVFCFFYLSAWKDNTPKTREVDHDSWGIRHSASAFHSKST